MQPLCTLFYMPPSSSSISKYAYPSPPNLLIDVSFQHFHFVLFRFVAVLGLCLPDHPFPRFQLLLFWSHSLRSLVTGADLEMSRLRHSCTRTENDRF